MKLIRFGRPGQERPGLILPDARRIDASGFGADYDEAFFASGGLERLAGWLAREGRTAPVVRGGHVAGYVLHNDYSERSFQLERGGQWVKGKSCDSFAPLGPFLATPDEIRDVHDLGLWLKVNGAMKQCGSTRELIFDVPTLVSYISQFMTLLPGDIISTGTPSGVGLGQSPPRYLADGDVVELGIDGLGSARQRLRAYRAGG